MGRKHKKIIRFIIIVIVILVGVGICGVLYLRGGKTQENLPAVLNEDAKKFADATKPSHIDSTDPKKAGFETKTEYNGDVVIDFIRQTPINFTDVYTKQKGIITFRGNNYRNSASFGTPILANGKFNKEFWTATTGEMAKSDITSGKGSDSWSGSGWTGQPIIIQWDDSAKQIMNLYPEKKSKRDLTEVIYATLSGEIYFLDLADGTPTRESIKLPYTFKGAGAIDPRGIPMMFVGGGDASPYDNSDARAFIISLIDGSILYEFGAEDEFAPRSFTAFDSSALVDANTDTLIYPGENGVLYSLKLNTNYDAAAGTLSISPSERVKWTYTTKRTRENTKKEPQQLTDTYWLGMEDSAVFWQNYMFIADNAGNIFCLDTTTMDVVWAQDIADDTNSTPVFEEVGKEKYLYIAPSLHWGKNKQDTGIINIYKLNAMTGDIVWQKPYDVHTVNGVSGGVQATPIVGQGEMSDLVIYPVARTPYKKNGLLVALDKNTGEERWVYEMQDYTWSSPVAIYDASGKGYIIACDSKGKMFLIEGTTGEVLDTIALEGNIEASPAVFNNTVVVGTRDKKIVGVLLG